MGVLGINSTIEAGGVLNIDVKEVRLTGLDTFTRFDMLRMIGEYTVFNAISLEYLSIEVDARGPNFGVVSACASGTHAIGEAQLAIQRGDADVVVCGGAEASMTPLMYGGFCAMKAMCAAYRGRQLLLFGSVHREAAAFRCWRERYGEGGSRRNKYWGRVAVRDIMWA